MFYLVSKLERFVAFMLRSIKIAVILYSKKYLLLKEKILIQVLISIIIIQLCAVLFIEIDLKKYTHPITLFYGKSATSIKYLQIIIFLCVIFTPSKKNISTVTDLFKDFGNQMLLIFLYITDILKCKSRLQLQAISVVFCICIDECTLLSYLVIILDQVNASSIYLLQRDQVICNSFSKFNSQGNKSAE